MVKRFETLALILFPLIALTVIFFLLGDATAALDDAWKEGTKP